MTEALETRAWTVAFDHPWPTNAADDPMCARHDPELWAPRSAADCAEAVRICGTCSLSPLCQDLAARRKETGVWGGVLFKEGRVLDEFPQPGRPSEKSKKAAHTAA